MLTGVLLALLCGLRGVPGVRCGGVTAMVIGEIADAPVRTPSGWRFLLRPEQIVSERESVRCDGLLAVTLLLRSGEDLEPAYGLRLCLRGVLSDPPGVRNPGEFNLRQYYRANGIEALVLVRGAGSCLLLPGGGGNWLYRTTVLPVRQTILRHIDRSIGGREGEFLKGLILGIRSGMTSEMREAFVNAGVAHILAVSGSNVAVIAVALSSLLLVLRLPGTLRDLVVACGILYYMVLTGSQPPVVRATVMALIVLAGRRMQRPVSALNSLGVAGLVILLLQPAQLFDVGFQLSFSAVLAIVLLYERSAALLRRVHSGPGRALRGILSLVAVSLVATLGTLPLTVLHFERVSVVGLLANIIVVPVSGLSVVLGLVGVLADCAGRWAGDAYAALNLLLLHWTLRFTMVAGSSSIAVVHAARWSLPASLAIASGLLALLYIGTPCAGRLAVATLLGWHLALLLPPGGMPPPAAGLMRVIFVDVGQGDCALLQLPDGGVVAIDLGERTPGRDEGQKTVLPLLRRLGADHIDAVLLTHPHRDHIGGFPAVSSGVGRAYRSATGGWPEAWRLDPLGMGEYLTLGRGVRIYALWPDRRDHAPEVCEGNNTSLVLRIQYGRTAFLFTGDIEAPVEERLVGRYRDFLCATVLKVPHHGAATGCTEEFLRAVGPHDAVISVGSGNRFAHPSDQTLERITDAGARLWRTDCGGAVAFESDGREVRLLSWGDRHP
jgi:competence protein ComEC